MRSKNKSAFTILEIIIVLIIISISFSIIFSSRDAYEAYMERREVERIKNAMADASRMAAGSKRTVELNVSEVDMQTLTIVCGDLKKEYKLKGNIKFKHPDGEKYLLKYKIYKSMAPSDSGRFFISGEYKDYEIIFTPVIAKFRVEVKDKND
ncbi:prepilin-type N-terminal cleavage/methylation domain-containing protein [Ezakiella peruensis]|uniref:prepilin-type N-terminal cleavage/methylation domain-containing protein n=1 Tax=Ezakiella peruensis TaxID=1464038 RepID=UPI000C1B183D|nr:prepilin-type N-terminal cleavage/methylation domain-containing protein [Ezakiella peruensis]